MNKETVVLLRDTIFKNIKYFNKTNQTRQQPPIVIRLDNDVRIDTSTNPIFWDDDNEVAYFYAPTKVFSLVQPIGSDHIEYKAILSAFDYGEIQEMYINLNNEAFGQSVAVLNQYAPGAKGTFLDHAGVTDDEYRQLWQKFIDSSDTNKIMDGYKINARVIFDSNNGSGQEKVVNVYYTGTTVELIDGSEVGGVVKSWNTAPDGSGRSYPVGYKLTPTSKELRLYAIR